MKTGIIGAMDEEVLLLKEAMQVRKTVTLARMDFCEGEIAGKEVVIVKSGVGKVNAALCTQILADRFAVTRLINTGVAGSLDARINIGDVVLSTDAVQHDVNATLFGYQPGEVPALGMVSFAADDALRKALKESVRTSAPDISCFEGRVASGDQFIADAAQKKHIKETFDALCCEMEGAAIAQAATLNAIPFCIIRAISDKADGSDIVDYPVFEKKAARDCAGIVIHYLKGA